jgi:hypothetical protein
VKRVLTACYRAGLGLFLTLAGLCWTHAADLSGRILLSTNTPVGNVADIDVLVVPAADASIRLSNSLAAAEVIGSRASAMKQDLEKLQNEKTKLLYRTMFPEVGPAEREDIVKQVEELNLRMAEIEHAITNKNRVPTIPVAPESWSTVIAKTRTDQEGRFRFPDFTNNSNTWIATSLPTSPQDRATMVWLVPILPRHVQEGLTLCVTNALQRD